MIVVWGASESDWGRGGLGTHNVVGQKGVGAGGGYVRRRAIISLDLQVERCYVVSHAVVA